MAVLNYAEISNLILDRVVANVTTDAPVSATVLDRFINDAYADIWEGAGGRLKKVSSTTAWGASANLCTGIVLGVLTDVEDVRHLYATQTAPQSLSCTLNSTVTITSAALFGSVVNGMEVTGTGIPAGAFVDRVASTSSLTISQAATTSGSQTLAFTPTVGTVELDPVDGSYLRQQALSNRGIRHTTPHSYSIERVSKPSGTTQYNVVQMSYWPPASGWYFPTHYVPQFTAIDAATNTVPDLNDLESRDLAYLAAMMIAPTLGRADLVPSIAANISQRTSAIIERKLAAMMEGKRP